MLRRLNMMKSHMHLRFAVQHTYTLESTKFLYIFYFYPRDVNQAAKLHSESFCCIPRTNFYVGTYGEV